MAYLNETYKSFDPGKSGRISFPGPEFCTSVSVRRKTGKSALLFTILAMVLSLVGLFGLVSFTAQQLTKEIGIRKVLGASLFNIVSLLSGSYLKLIAIAACIALPVSWFIMDRWLSDFAYRIPLQIRRIYRRRILFVPFWHCLHCGIAGIESRIGESD